MGKGTQKASKNRKRNKRAGRAANKAARSRRAGRKPQEKEPGINTADLIHIVGALWPRFNEYLDSVDDFRRQDRIIYDLRLLLFLAILERIMGHDSNRQHDYVKYDDPLKETVSRLMDSYPEFLPHSDTIKYAIERLKPGDIDGIRRKMVNKLLRGKKLYGARTGDWLGRSTKYYRVAIDGVHFHSSSSPIPHSIHRTHSNGETEYMLMAIEACLVMPGGIRIPLMTEFIENPDTEYDKQDCELKAAKRLLARLKDKFARLKLIILLDGLYLCHDILKTCRLNGWELSVTVTEKVSAFLRKAEEKLNDGGGKRVTGIDPVDGRKRTVMWRNSVKHILGGVEFKLNVIKMTKQGENGEECLFFATTIFLRNDELRTLRILDEICRLRWQIEEQFKVQKHHGFELEAAFGTRGFAGQNYYLIVQIANIIRIFMMHSSLFRRLQQHFNSEKIKEVIQLPMLKYFHTIANMVDNFRRDILHKPISEIDISKWRLAYDTA